MDYVRTVYQDRGVSRAQLLQRLPLIRWWYHSAPLDLACRQDNFLFARRSMERAKWTQLVCNLSLVVAIYLRRPMVTAALTEHGFWMARCHPGEYADEDRIGRQSLRPQHHPDDTWVEVLRIATSSCTSKEGRCEGGKAGCWFSKAVGSGVFLHTGRSLRVDSRAQLAAALRVNASEAFAYYLRENRVRPGAHLPLKETEHLLQAHHLVRLKTELRRKLSARELSQGRRLFASNTIVLDYTVCEHATAAGYDTVQLWDPKCDGDACFPEVVSCHPGCASASTGSVRGACVPARVPLRTGWDATRRCLCNVSLSVLNCFGGSTPLQPAPTDTSSSRIEAGSPSVPTQGSFSAKSFFKLRTCVHRSSRRIQG